MRPIFHDLTQTLVGKGRVRVGFHPSAVAPSLPPRSEPQHDEMPARFDRFILLKELGTGAEGRVYLASQPELSNRPVVLKVTRDSLREHLLLARLQHTNIVPLYGIHEEPERDERALCMPYFGRVTLSHLFERMVPIPVRRRRGQEIVTLLKEGQAEDPVAGAVDGPTRDYLARAGYVQAICWIGACLADALHYAHQRGLIHYDIKPSNVLLTADGQPMLLDFHLARGPLQKGAEPPGYFGGTPPYWSPEQETICLDSLAERPLSKDVDGRADIYALGMLLLHGLSDGSMPRAESVRQLRRINPEVSIGLADILRKCLAPNPAERYATAGDLAQDLRCHLQDLPLRGVRNRSPIERWRKWRRRQPFALPLYALLICLTLALAAAGALTRQHIGERRQQAERCFFLGQSQLRAGRFPQAMESFDQGLTFSNGIGGEPGLRAALREHLALARRAHLSETLKQIVDRFRLGSVSAEGKNPVTLTMTAEKIWNERHELLNAGPTSLDPKLEQDIRRELLELAVLWADLSLTRNDRAKASALLAEARELRMSGPILDWQALRLTSADTEAWADALQARSEDGEARTAWEHSCLAAALIRAGRWERASRELDACLALDPADYWANFFQAEAALRLGKPQRALACLGVCIGARPLDSECFLRRGRAHLTLGDGGQALADLNRALEIRPNWTAALLERGAAYTLLGQPERAKRDPEQASEQGGIGPREH